MSQDAGPVPRNSGILGSQGLVDTCPSLGLAYIPRRPYVADGQYRISRGCAASLQPRVKSWQALDRRLRGFPMALRTRDLFSKLRMAALGSHPG